MVKTRIYDIDDPVIMEIFKEVIESDGVVVFPTDTCYGLAVNAFSPHSVKRIYDIKKRTRSLPLSVTLAANYLHLYADLSIFPDNKLPDNLPTPITLVLKPLVDFPTELMSNGKVGFRIGDHHQINKLLAFTKLVLTSTSANISGSPEPYSVLKVLEGISEDKIDLIINGGNLSTDNRVSAVVDLTGPQPVVIREGKVVSELLDLLKKS